MDEFTTWSFFDNQKYRKNACNCCSDDECTDRSFRVQQQNLSGSGRKRKRKNQLTDHHDKDHKDSDSTTSTSDDDMVDTTTSTTVTTVRNRNKYDTKYIPPLILNALHNYKKQKYSLYPMKRRQVRSLIVQETIN